MIELIIVIAVVGFLVWLVSTYVKMPDPFKYAIYFVAAIGLLFFIMRAFGIADIPLK